MQTEERAYESSFDLPELLARVDNDRELLQEIFEIYQQEFPMLQLQLRDAWERGDMEEVRVAAHTLKGMLSSMSFMRASTSAMRIERMASQWAPEGIGTEIGRMERNAELAQANLASVCREVTR
jgi:two-component system sensor histidine kinase/response regulator